MTVLSPARAQASSQSLSVLEVTALIGIVLIWGLNNFGAKVATREMSPLLVVALRFTLATLILAPFIRPPFPPLKVLIPLTLTGGALHFAVLYGAFALSHTLTPLTIALQLWIPLATLMAWLLLKERPSPAALAGLLTAFAGVAVMSFDARMFEEWPAIGMGALASIIWATATVLARKTSGMAPLKMQGVMALSAAPVLWVAALTFEPNLGGQIAHASWRVWASIVFAAVGSTAIATAALFWLVQRREAGRVTPYFLLSPIVTIACGVLWLGDQLSWRIVLGGILSFSGAGVVAVAERRLGKA